MKQTKQIRLGDVRIGGGAPVSVQSMTNTDTRDAQATLAQIQAVAESWESQRVETSFLAGVIGIDIINLRQGTVAEIREAVEKIKPAHLPLEITERQYVETPILVGALARQGDSMILWEVDCRNDP